MKHTRLTHFLIVTALSSPLMPEGWAKCIGALGINRLDCVSNNGLWTADNPKVLDEKKDGQQSYTPPQTRAPQIYKSQHSDTKNGVDLKESVRERWEGSGIGKQEARAKCEKIDVNGKYTPIFAFNEKSCADKGGSWTEKKTPESPGDNEADKGKKTYSKNRQNNMDELEEENTAKKWGCKYGGFCDDVSAVVAKGLGETQKLLGLWGAAKVQEKQVDETTNLTNKGQDLSGRDIADSQKRLRDESADRIKAARNQALGAGSINTAMGLAHTWSAFRISRNAKLKEAQLNAALMAESDPSMKHEIKKKLDNVQFNGREAKKAQFIAAAGMAMNATKNSMEAYQLNAEKNLVQNMPDPTMGANYNVQLTEDQGPQNQLDHSPLVASLDDQKVIETVEEGKNDPTKEGELFNQNDPTENPNAPSAERLASEAPTGPRSDGAGGGAGGVGGTSAAQDDGSSSAPAKTKDQVGSYAAMDAGGGKGFSGSRSSGGGAGEVGVESAFADLLKKLLPGEEAPAEKDAGAEQVALGDRAPASDQAAVIGRNQNIFEVIHKRYLKKNREGAVQYSL